MDRRCVGPLTPCRTCGLGGGVNGTTPCAISESAVRRANDAMSVIGGFGHCREYSSASPTTCWSTVASDGEIRPPSNSAAITSECVMAGTSRSTRGQN
eukprot:3218269-Pyramimonas_sp.AAC.1